MSVPPKVPLLDRVRELADSRNLSAEELKQIADHLGHRSINTTRIYTKIDLHGLRQVAELDLGGLL